MTGIISDVHGNYPALAAVIEKLKEYKCDEIISLGDVAGYYCMINECIDLCRENKIVNILGNHDLYLLSGEGCPRSSSANVCLNYQKEVITEDRLQWLKTSVPFVENNLFSLRHGGWKDPVDEYLYDFSFDMVNGYDQRIFASGHTHIAKLQEDAGRVYFNPGSVGQPRDRDPRAAFAIIDDHGRVHMHRVEYSVQAIQEKMRQAGFADRMSACLQTGTRIGEV